MPNIPQDDLLNIDKRSQEEKYLADLQTYSVYVNEQEKILIASQERIKKLTQKFLKDKSLSEKEARKKALEEELNHQERVYKKINLQSRDIYLKRRSYEIELLKQRLDSEEEAQLAGVRSIKKREKIQKEFEQMRNAYTEKQIQYEKELLSTQEAIYRVTQKYADAETRHQNIKQRLEASKEELKNLIKEHDLLKEQYKDNLENKEYLEKEAVLAERIQSLGKQRVADKKEYYAAYQEKYEQRIQRIKSDREDSEEIQKILGKREGIEGLQASTKSELEMQGKIIGEAIAHYQETKEAVKRGEATADDLAEAENSMKKAQQDYDQLETRGNVVDALVDMKKTLNTSLVNIQHSINSEVEKAITTIKEYQPKILARLQGSDKTYKQIRDTLSKNLAASPFVSYKETLENVAKLVDLGIAYNIEERAFLQSVSEDIATTFDAFDSTLLRLIRLQQADTTAARMGMEAYLTKFLNSMFSDTSYLNQVYDTVSEAIIDAQSQATFKEGTSFEYTLQKWMGSLYSLGFSEGAIQRIAKGINMLQTGDVQGLANDSAMQTLLAMSASRSGTVNYAEAALYGMTSQQLNDLLLSMVTYLQEIATNSDTRVIKSAFGDIFDMSLSDFASIQNLQTEDIEKIYNSTLSYDRAFKEMQQQLLALPTRLALSDMINNLATNVLFTAGEKLASDPVHYATWLITDMIEQATGGIHLPAISIFGNMVDLSAFTIEGIVKTSLVGLGLLFSTFDLMSSLANLGGISPDIFNTWGASETLSRGTGIVLETTGMTSGISNVQYIGAGDEKAYRESIMKESMDEAQKSPVSSSETQNLKNVNDLYMAMFSDNEKERKKISVEFEGTSLGAMQSIGDILSSVYNSEYNAIKIWQDRSTSKVSSNTPLFTEGTLAELEVLINTTADQASLNVNVTNDPNVKLLDFDQKFEDKLRLLIKRILTGNPTSTDTVIEGEEEEDRLKELFNKLLTGKIDVNVTNDNFDEFLIKNMWQY